MVTATMNEPQTTATSTILEVPFGATVKLNRGRFVGLRLTKEEYDELYRRSGAKKRGDFSDWVRKALFSSPEPPINASNGGR